MRRDEFPLIEKIRKDDMEYLLKQFELLLNGKNVTEDIAMGICLCMGITKAYKDELTRVTNT